MSHAQFTSATVPLTLMPKTFVEGLEQKFVDYSKAMTVFDDTTMLIERVYNGLKGAAPTLDVQQRYLSILCSRVLNAGRDRALFLTYCYKNAVFVDRVTKRHGAMLNAFNNRVSSKTEFFPPAFKDHAYLSDELMTLYSDMQHSVGMAYTVMSGATRAARADRPTHGDPFLESLNQNGRLYLQDYHNWLEYHFLRKFNLRLSLFPVMADTKHLIEKKIASPHFGRQLLSRVANAKLQGSFPGLSIDAMPANPSELDLARQRIASHGAFTPDQTAHVIKISSPSA